MSENMDEIIDRDIKRRIARRAQLLATQMDLDSPEIIIDRQWELLGRAFYRWKELRARERGRRLEEEIIEGQ